MNVFRLASALLLSLFVAACGGGGTSSEDGAVIPAQAGSADIGPAGGLVTATFEGGAAVTLIVPAKALAATTTIRVDPGTAPADALAAMTMSPAGLQFAVPATLSIVLPSGSDASNKLVTFGIGGVRVPIGAVDPAARTMSVDLLYLGVGAAEPASVNLDAFGGRAGIAAARQRPAAASEATLELFVQNGDLTSAVTLWHQLVATLASNGSRDNAIEVQEGFTALLSLSLDAAPQSVKDQVGTDLTTWRNVDCGQLTSSISALNSFDFSSDFAGYTRRATDVLAFGRLTQDLFTLATQIHFIAPGACPALQSDISAPVRPTFPSYIAAATATLQALSPVDDFNTLLNARLGQLLNFTASLQAFGGVDDLAAQVQALAANQTVRLRAGAYTDCRTNHSQVKQQTLLAKEIGDPAFEPLSPYDRSDLIADIQYCGMLIHWEVLDATDAVLQKGDAGGILPGVIVSAPTVNLSGAARLVLSGPLSALNCPSGSNNEQLTFGAGPASGATSSVGTLTPGGDSSYLGVSDLSLQVTRLLELANPGGGTANGRLVIQRTGSACNTDFPDFTAHAALVNFKLTFNGVAITTSFLPGAIIGSTYVTQMLSIGGTAPFTWTATGLPSGLGIEASTGLISGTPTDPGTATVVVTVQASDGSTAQTTLFLEVDPNFTRWGILVDYTCGTSGPASLVGPGVGFNATETGDQVSGPFGLTTLQRGGLSCPDGQDRMSGTFTATEQKDPSGAVVALTNVVVTVTIDATPLGNGATLCVDNPIVFPGPIPLVAPNRFTGLVDGFFSAKCFSGGWTAVQLVKLR